MELLIILQIPIMKRKGANELYLYILTSVVIVFLLWFRVYKQTNKNKSKTLGNSMPPVFLQLPLYSLFSESALGLFRFCNKCC